MPVLAQDCGVSDVGIGSWLTAGRLDRGREDAALAPLGNGDALLIGGFDGDAVLSSTRLFDASTGSFLDGPDLIVARRQASATVLPDGRILVVGGLGVEDQLLDSSEIYDPDSGEFGNLETLARGRFGHTATRLNDRRVLIVGGTVIPDVGDDPEETATAELYDPESGWTSAPDMNNARREHTATGLDDGRVMVIGGRAQSLRQLETVEIFDPSIDDWASGVPLPEGRGAHASVVLDDGRVVVIGGLSWQPGDPEPSVEPTTWIFDWTLDSWDAGPNLQYPRRQFSARRLPDGRILVVAGQGDDSCDQLSSAELVDPLAAAGAGRVVTAASVPIPRFDFSLTLLADGRVLAVGGRNNEPGLQQLSSAFLFIPDGGEFASTGSLLEGRKAIDGVLLPNGRVLTAIGRDADGEALATGEVFDPLLETFFATGGVDEARTAATLSVLHDGRAVLVGGGRLRTVDVYDPWLGTFTRFGDVLVTGRQDHTANVLADGSLLVCGGSIDTPSGSTYADTCERISFGEDGPVSEIVAERPGVPWFRHTTTALADGRILLVGGLSHTNTPLHLADIFDPFFETLTSVESMDVARRLHGATALPDGRVLITGGNEGLRSAEIYDPVANTWALVQDMGEGFSGHSSVALADGSVLIFGDRGISPQPTSKAVLRFDPASTSFVPAGELVSARSNGASVVLAEGRVLTFGGNGAFDGIDSAELYSSVELPPGVPLPTLDAPLGVLDPLSDWQIQGGGLRASTGTGDGGRLDSDDRLTLTLRSLSDGRVRRLEVISADDQSVRVRAPSRHRSGTAIFDPPPAGFHLMAPMLAGRVGQGAIVKVACGLDTTDPVDQTVELREIARFDAFSDGGRGYQWQQSEDGGTTWRDIDGAVGPSYQTPPALGDDHLMRFRARVDAGCATVTTAPATLSVIDDKAPEVTVTRPADGEVWILSIPGAEPHRQVVTWSIQDDLPLASLALELHWTHQDGQIGSQPLCDGQSCVPPSPESREVLFELPSDPPGGIGARYRIRLEAEDVAGNRADGFSGEILMVSEDPDLRTLFLTHRGRLEMSYAGAEVSRLFAALSQLANHPRVAGLVVDLGESPGFDEALFDLWDESAGDPDLANRVLFAEGGAHGVVSALLEAYPAVEHLVFVGGDQIVPFARLEDETPILRPSDYLDPSRGEPGAHLTAPETMKALAADRYFSDDPMAVLEPLRPEDLSPGSLMLADLSVGRLVETPEEMIGVVNRFLDRDGVVELASAAGGPTSGAGVSGYDFLTDVALRVGDRLGDLIGESAVDDSLADGIWSDPPGPDAARSALSELLASEKSLLGLFGHAHHLGLGVPGVDRFDQRALLGLEISGTDECGEVGSSTDLAGAVIYGVGCHGGLSVPDSCGIEDDADYDLPQALLGSGALGYLANSGYGWGLLYGVGYAERLVELFTEQLETGAVELGPAAQQAKRQYVLENSRLDPFDVKTLQQWILFGLPMIEIRSAAPDDVPAEAVVGPEIALEHQVLPAGEPEDPPDLTRVSTRIDFSAEGVYRYYDAGGLELEPGAPCPTPDGCYYALNDLTTGESDLPVEPYFTYTATLSGVRPRGVIWLGGQTSETLDWTPLIARLASNEDEGTEGLPPALPRMVVTGPIPTELGGGCLPGPIVPLGGASESVARVTVTAGITVFDPDAAGATRHLRFEDYGLETFYGEGPCQGQGPEFGEGPFDGAYHQWDGAGLRFAVPVHDTDAVWRVVAVWTTDESSAYLPVELERGDDGLFRGEVPHDELDGSVLTYLLQAVDRSGQVSFLPFEGAPADAAASSAGDGLPSSGIALRLPRTVDVDLRAPTAPPTLRQVRTVPEWRQLLDGDRLDLALARFDVELSAPVAPVADIRLAPLAGADGAEPVCADGPALWPTQVFAGPTAEVLSLRLAGSPPPVGRYRLMLCDVRDALAQPLPETHVDFEITTDHWVENGGFDFGLEGWTTGGDPAVFFVEQDASQVPGSFSLQLSVGPGFEPVVRQCLDLSVDELDGVLRAAMHARTEHCAGGEAWAGFQVDGFVGGACEGAATELGRLELRFSDSGPGIERGINRSFAHGVWFGATQHLTASNEWSSFRIQLSASADRSCEVWIDQVGLSPRGGAIFIDGFESGDGGAWSN